MHTRRRDVLKVIATISLTNGSAAETINPMYGLIVKITAVAGQRDSLIAILLEGTGKMPGCLSYIIAKDASDEDSLWITEVWDNKASHDASLTLPAVKNSIVKGRPLIAAFGTPSVTVPVGGHGLAQSAK